MLVIMGCNSVNSDQQSQITFAATMNGTQGIYRIGETGSNLRLVMADGTSPAFQPLGDRIVFVRGGNNLFVVREDGGNLTQLTNNGIGVTVDGPAFSRDGQTVVFSTSTVVLGALSAIHLIGINGGTESTVVVDGTQPAFAPDGTSIVFVRGVDIYLININGTGLLNLTNNGVGVASTQPTFTPDGTQIAFTTVAVTPGAVPVIEVMNINRSARQTLLANASSPTYHPNGSRIAFVRDNNLFTATAGGSAITQLTNNLPIATGGRISWGALQ
jgi:Tol biopolymer transport system component